MLAQSFKSAADLEITEPQLSALIKTLVLLETGKIKHVPELEISGDMARSERAFSGLFNMGTWAATSHNHCGTICCIGGTAELIGDLKFGVGFGLDIGNDKLKVLFYPPTSLAKWDHITPAHAATALRSYLTTGDARWDLAVKS